MGIPEELKAIAIERRSMESQKWELDKRWESIKYCGSSRPSACGIGYTRDWAVYQKTGTSPQTKPTLDKIAQLNRDIEANKVREQGLIDKWNAEKMQLADQNLRKELAIEQGKLKTAERKAKARGGHPEHGLSATYRPPPRRAKSGVRSRYAAPKRRSASRPRPRPRPQGRR